MKLPVRNKLCYAEIKSFVGRVYSQNVNAKPNGFWYSYYNDHYNLSNSKALKYKYIYEIKIKKDSFTNIANHDKNKLLYIDTKSDFELFTATYGVYGNANEFKFPPYTFPFYNTLIDWKEVERYFGGIDVNPCINIETYMWYNKWAFAGGCVWNPESIIDIYPITL